MTTPRHIRSRPPHQPAGTRPHRRSKQIAVVASAALAAGTLGAVPASGSVTGPGVRNGSNITVLHNIDLVHVSGYGLSGGDVTVQVLRDGVPIGSATGPAQLIEGAMGLEVNHGVEAAPAPGDCWDGHTPNVRPGDVIRVTDSVGTDEATVDDISFTGAPSVADNGDVLVQGVAKTFEGNPIAASALNAAEFRAGSRLRAGSDEITVTSTAGVPGGFTMRYPWPFNFERNRDNLSAGEIQQALLGDGHAVGFLNAAEGMLVEGLGDTPGPAAGCEGSPLAEYAVTSVTPRVINVANQNSGLTVSGMSHDSSAVTVQLRDPDGTLVTGTATPAPSTGFQTWTVSFTAAQLADLNGSITVSGLYTDTDTGQDVSGLARTMLKDTVAPGRPSPSLAAGTYRGTQKLTLAAGPGERIRYTLGGRTTPAPTPTSGTQYTGRAITLTSSQTLRTIAVDAAGNSSPVARHRYVIRNVPSSPRIRRASSGAPGGRATAVARWAAPQFTGGSRITGYRVTALRLRRNGSVMARKISAMLGRRAEALQMRLRPGRYRFQVRAFNAVGPSRNSGRSNVVRSR